MKSYLKIYGPPLLKALKALEKLAISMPKVCIMDTIIASQYPSVERADFESPDLAGYFRELGVPITQKRCENIISRSGETDFGDHDFYFEWFEKPNRAELEELISKIDETLTPLGCKYTLTSKIPKR